MKISYKLNNVQKSLPDDRDKIFIAQATNLPKSVDLKEWADEVEDQYTLNSCTGNAGVSALEIMYKRNGLEKDFSRLFLYWYIRELGNIVGDEGGYPRDIGKALHKFGVCYEKTWPYLTSTVNTEPSGESITEAIPYRINKYERIVGDNVTVLNDIKTALAQGIPVLASMFVHDDFMSLSGDWKGHDWNTRTNITGGHQVLVIGYDDLSQRLLAENSWGNRWGDGGFFGVPYRMIGDNFTEWWILSDVGVPNIPVEDFKEDENMKEKTNPIKIILAVAVVAVVVVTLWLTS